MSIRRSVTPRGAVVLRLVACALSRWRSLSGHFAENRDF